MAYIFDANTDTPESVARRREVADALASRVFSQAPQNVGQGIAAIGQALIARQMGQEADAAQRAGQQSASAAFAPIAGSAPAPMVSASPSDAASAIAGIESGGDYGKLGPVTKTGDRAYGKYQVMGANIPEWTRAHLGQPMTPDQFLANPAAQDAVFNGQFGQYAQKYGPNGAARAWFAGEGGMNNPNARDQLGTTVQAYADRFDKGMGAADNSVLPSNAQPTQGFMIPGQAQTGTSSPTFLQAAQVMNNRWASKGQQAVAQAIMQQQLKSDDQTAVVGNNLVNKRSGQVIYSADDKPKFQVIGEDQFGKKIYGYPPKLGEAPAPTMQQPTIPDNAIDLHGDDFLKTLDRTTATQVRSIIEGRTPYPTGMLLKTPFGQKLSQYVTQADPTFEAGNAMARTKMQADLSVGKLGQNINALNTAIGHAGELSDAATKLNNYGNQWVNSVKNHFNTVTGAPEVTNFNTIRDKVAEEFTKVYRGSGGSEADIKREIENMNAANSPAQLHGAIANMARLAQSKIDANEAQYKNTMGPMVRYAPMISDKTKATLEMLEQREKGMSSGQANKTSNGVSWSIQ